MSSNSNLNGRAFEYIALVRLGEEISKKRAIQTAQDGTYLNAEKAWNEVGEKLRYGMDESARQLSKTLFDLEPMIAEDDGEPLILSLQSDEKGQKGDVRDILLTRKKAGWEIGLSLKHNHFAVKHSRLGKSRRNDFAKKWCGHPCSQEYWDDIAPIFERVEKLKKQFGEWNKIEDKDTSIYVPLLEAFCAEIRRCNQALPDFPGRIVSYMMGEFDFYKVVSVNSERAVKIMGVNLQGSLNRPAGKIKPRERILRTKLPTRLVEVGIKRGTTNTVEMIFDGGWAFSLRIHNAETRIISSLKFDIRFLGLPMELSQMSCPWSGH